MGALRADASPDAPSADAEALRLAALRRYEILDTPPEPEFDEVAALAADLLCSPIALVSLVDEHRQWCKASFGIDAEAVPRAWAFCVHVLGTAGRPLVVPDAEADPRFADNPVVVDGRPIRFYAGAPLVAPDGLTLGTVCVLSPEPRPAGLPAEGVRRLSSLAAITMRALENRREARQSARLEAEAEARQAREERLRTALDAAGGCAWELHPRSGLSTWDAAARELFGVGGEPVRFAEALRLFAHPDDADAVRAAVARALQPAGDGRFAVEHRGARPGADGRARWFRSVGQARFGVGRGGRRTGAKRLVCTSIEVTEQRAAEERQALLVAELNHRVKNTLAVVQALAEQTHRATGGGAGGQAPSPEEPTGNAGERRRFHADFQSRLLALSRAHDLLTRKGWRATSLAELAHVALAPFQGAGAGPPRIEAAGPPVLLAPEPAVALAMALHELATNAAKHGALSRPAGRASLSWAATPDGAFLELAWTESGGPSVPGRPTRHGFGLRLLERALARQLGGQASVDYPPSGLAYRLRVPFGDRVTPG